MIDDPAVQAAADAFSAVMRKPSGGRLEAITAAVAAARPMIEKLVEQELSARVTPHCPTCTCGCTCGYGGFHEPENPRCELNVSGP